ncbi:MAG TPA: hypothetical protein PK513_01145 [Alphaproteobacteria bacterium]|nr:hypothetical protein [Alphaproteobacteria bacterium]
MKSAIIPFPHLNIKKASKISRLLFFPLKPNLAALGCNKIG